MRHRSNVSACAIAEEIYPGVLNLHGIYLLAKLVYSPPTLNLNPALKLARNAG
jgi:hypothetical protein